METWQLALITGNLSLLVKNTIPNAVFLAILQQDNALSDIDVAQIETQQTSYDQAKLLYDKLITKTNGYYTLVEALKETCQSGAARILFDPIERISTLRVCFQGKTHALKDLLNPNQIKWIETCLREKSSTEDFLKTFENISNKTTELKLIRDTIPPTPNLYIQRYVLRRLTVNPSVFETSCQDVFVFKQIRRQKLREFVTSYGISSSTQELLKNKITSRFILLDVEIDWKKICAKIETPLHLFRYEDTTNAFVLEETSGNSTVLSQYLMQSDDSNAECLSENDFVKTILAQNPKGVCICDLPGIGKSYLLASLARQINRKCPQSITAFLKLRDFTISENSANDIRQTMLNQIATSKLASLILYELTKFGVIKFELFFDGLDEVQESNLEQMTNFLQQIGKNMPESRIYVTSRPVVRTLLEKALKVISYDIKPFDNETQEKYLTTFWLQPKSTSDLEKLKIYAKFCLDGVKNLITEKDRNITGVPLQCWLIAKVYSEKAAIFADNARCLSDKRLETFVNSLHEIYSKFIARQLGESKCNYACLYETCSEKIQCGIDCQVKSFHVCKAIELIVPNLSERKFAKYLAKFGDLHLTTILSSGLLEKCISNGKFDFLHRTFAEYLVADYFAKSVRRISEKQKNAKCLPLEQLVFDEIVSPGHKIKFNFELFTLREHVVAYFANAILTDTCQNIEIVSTFVASPFHKHFCPTLEGLLYEDFEQLLQIYLRSAQIHKPRMFRIGKTKTNLKIDNEIATNLLRVASAYSNKNTFCLLVDLFQNLFNVDLIKQTTLHNSKYSPIQIATKRANYELVHYLVDKMPLENQGLLHRCVEDTYFDEEELVELKLDVANLLLSKCTNLINEVNPLTRRKPLFSRHVHFQAIKFLIEKGANVREVDYEGRTILYLAAAYMSNKDFLELSKHLLDDHNARDWFIDPAKIIEQFKPTSLFSWPDPNNCIVILRLLRTSVMFSNINESASLDQSLIPNDFSQTLVEILTDLIQPAFYNEYKVIFEYLFIGAVAKGLKDIANLLLNFDVSLQEIRFDENENVTPILLAAYCARQNMVKLLVSRRANIFAVGSSGNTVLHFAAATYNCNTLFHIIKCIGEFYDDCKINRCQSSSKEPKTVQELFNWHNHICSDTPLHSAVENINDLTPTLFDLLISCGKTSKISSSVEIGVNLNAVNTHGRTALYSALLNKQKLDLIKHMVNRGADWSVIDVDGCNLAHHCAVLGLPEHLMYFVELGCNVNLLNSKGNNVLQYALIGFKANILADQRFKIVQMLISAGVKLNNRNFDDQTAHDIAVKEFMHPDVVKLLILPKKSFVKKLMQHTKEN